MAREYVQLTPVEAAEILQNALYIQGWIAGAVSNSSEVRMMSGPVNGKLQDIIEILQTQKESES